MKKKNLKNSLFKLDGLAYEILTILVNINENELGNFLAKRGPEFPNYRCNEYKKLRCIFIDCFFSSTSRLRDLKKREKRKMFM